MLNVQIDHPDGTSDSIMSSRFEGDYIMDEMDIGIAHIDRSIATSIPLYEDQDEVTITYQGEREFFGVLRDVVSNDGQVKLVIDSPERFAKDAERSDGDLVYDPETDRKIVRDAIADIPQLSERNVEMVESQNTFIFSHASPAKRIREVSSQTAAEVMYHPDATVEYAERIGRDRTESETGIVLSPSTGNISDAFSPERISGDEHATHLTMLGTGEGQAQRRARIVPDSDPRFDGSQSDVFTYSDSTDPSDWGDTKRRAWSTKINKEVNDTAMLGKNGLILIEELLADFTEVDTTVENYEVQLGDIWTVRNPAEDVDKDLRAMEVTEIIDTDGRRYETKFSNRRLTRQTKDKEIEGDVDNYNMAFEGTNVTMTPGGGRQPVDSNLDYEFSFYYPDEVNYEHRVKLFMKGDAYRAYSKGALAGGEHVHQFEYVATGEHYHQISSSEFNHYHSLTPQNADAESHDHNSGSYDAVDHPHGDGSYGADNHGHGNGSYGADNHEHPYSNDQPTRENNIHGQGSVDDSGLVFADGTDGDWVTAHQFRFSDYEFITIHAMVSRADRPVHIRAKDTLSAKTWPRDQGQAIWGSTSNSGAGNGLIFVPEDVSWVNLQYKTNTTDPVGNIQATGQAVKKHEHNNQIVGDTDRTGPAVLGISGDDAPDVGGWSEDANADVAGYTGNFSPGVQGRSESEGGVRTSTTQEQTGASTTTPPEQGGHQHAPEPGVILFNEHYPENCDVRVNGQEVGVSLGDGNGSFTGHVDLEGALTPGTVNTVEVTSESLGHMQAHIDIDVFREINGRG